MYKLSLLFCGFFLFACKNQSSSSANNKDTSVTNTTNGAAQTAATTDEMEFLSTCVDNARPRLGEQKAYVLCRCVYGQVQQKYPGADSATLMQHLNDTAEVAKMAQQCK